MGIRIVLFLSATMFITLCLFQILKEWNLWIVCCKTRVQCSEVFRKSTCLNYLYIYFRCFLHQTLVWSWPTLLGCGFSVHSIPHQELSSSNWVFSWRNTKQKR
jgi:hypothetical protein